MGGLTKLIFGKQKYIKEMKKRGIDIIINTNGFKDTYDVFYRNNKVNFQTWNEVKDFCEQVPKGE